MSNFLRLSEALNRIHESIDPRVEAVFRNKSKEFWKDLAKLASGGNKEGLALLLGVDTSQIRNWASRISDAMKQIEIKERELKRNEMLPTGTELGDVERATVGGHRPSNTGIFGNV